MTDSDQTNSFGVDGTGLAEESIESQHLYRGRIVNLRFDTVRLANGCEATREVVEHVAAAAAVPLLPDGRVLLVEQWRHAVGHALLEIPAGLVEDGEQPAAAMHRELIEETGYAAGHLVLLFSLYLAPGYSQELIHIFLAENLEPGQAAPDEDEILRVRAVPLAEAVAACLHGEISDAKTVAGLLAVAALRELD